jgi:hypothetical protein
MIRKTTRRLPPIAKWPDWVFLLIFFTYFLAISLLIQLVLLPHVFPAWHAGNGLLVGTDSETFNRLAVRQAQAIITEGWQVWSLVPGGQPVAGIASIFYVLISPHPWVLLPLNAFLHILAAWVLFKILGFFLEKRSHALLATLPFLLFPSALTWVAQMHNDNYAVTGSVLILYGWVCFARQESWRSPKRILGGILAILGGGGLIWMVRNYLVDMFTAIGGLLLVFLILLFLVRRGQSRWTWKKTISAITVVCITFFLVAGLRNIKLGAEGVVNDTVLTQTIPGEEIVSAGDQPTDLGTDTETRKPNHKSWEYAKWLPSWLDLQMEQLSIKRAKAIRSWTNPSKGVKGSNIDINVTFHSALDIAVYLPRAVEIGFLAPFPTDWFDRGSKAPNTMMRRVSGLEMFFVYLCWPGFFYALWIWRKRPELWIMFSICAGMLIIYTLGTPNIGSLYRFRYPYIMPMVGMGVAGWIAFIRGLSPLIIGWKLRQRISH